MAMDALIPELYCADIKQSLHFYTKILDFKILYDRPEDQFAMLVREEAKIMLEGPIGRKWITGSLEYPLGRGLNLQIKVSNAESLHQAAQGAKLPIFLPLEEKWYRKNDKFVGNKQFAIQDPDGYLLRFAQDLGSRPVE